jgi:hypothetical protein
VAVSRRVAAAIAAIAFLLVPVQAVAQEDDAGPEPPYEGDPGNIGSISVSGGGAPGSLVSGSFSPTGTSVWQWSYATGTQVSGCGATDTSCQIRLPQNLPSGYKYDPETDRWELNTETGSGWLPMGVTRRDPGEYPWFVRDWFKVLHTAPPEQECFGEATPAPQPVIVGGSDWSFLAHVSPDDGLVVQDVKLGERYMAAQMSLPYLAYWFDSVGVGRLELGPAGSGEPASRLTDFDVDQRPGGVGIRASYGIDGLPGDACLEVTQDYTFSSAVPGDHCEPAGKLPCARFTPAASYGVVRAPQGMGPGGLRVVLPQRLEFVDENSPFNVAALALDQDTPNPVAVAQAVAGGVPALSAPVIRRMINPVPTERLAAVIRGGLAATGEDGWDNYHQTYFSDVLMPRFLAPENVADGKPVDSWVAVPGCPECIHMHWRWGTISGAFPGFEDAHGGHPRIEPESKQDVTVGIVRVPDGAAATAESDPTDWRGLANGESLGATAADGRTLPQAGDRARIVLWYEGASGQSADAFLTHGGFFGVDAPGIAQITEVKLSPSAFSPGPVAQGSAKRKRKGKKKRKGGPAKGAELRFALSEWGALIGTVEQTRPGRKRKGRCVKPGRKKRGKRCKRTVVLDQLIADGGTDRTTIAFSGRVGRRPLKPGRYRLVLRGRDLSGDLSKARKLGFRILSRRKAK